MNKNSPTNEFIKYGKPSKEMLAHKQDFFLNNDVLLSNSIDLNKLYSQQPERTKCKNCNAAIAKTDFTKLYVDYSVCEKCGHLNGKNEDSDFFVSHVYTDNKGLNYSKNYSGKTKVIYDKRTDDIYMPKVQFLKDAFLNFDINPNALSFSDVGAGSGYFVSSMKNIGFNNINGYDVSEQQITFGNSMIGEDLLKQFDINETISLIESIDTDVVSMIGVLEHLRQPREFLQALKLNQNIRFFYFSVPLFSMTVFFEMLFPNIMNRQLSGDHTHLYTEQSIEHMVNEFKFKRIASWWFGTDMADLYRSTSVALSKKNYDSKMIELWKDMFSPIIDLLQLELDNKHLSSEVHMLLRVD
jgi:hypothetical protein